MGGFFTIWCGPSRRDRGLSWKWLGVLLAIWTALTPALLSAEQLSSTTGETPSQDRAAATAVRPVFVQDVVVDNGVLHGMIVADPAERDRREAVAGVRVAALRDGEVVAEARSDAGGRFALSNLRGGRYAIVVARPGRVESNHFRVWTPGAAPPKASAVARLIPGGGIARGQGPLPAVSFSEAAIIAGVVAGAVAAPIIYHNAQKSNRVPASP